MRVVVVVVEQWWFGVDRALNVQWCDDERGWWW